VVVAVLACARAQTADVIYRGGPILTLTDALPRAEAIAVADGRILAVGGAEQVRKHRGEATRVVDLEGRALLPGFIDSHSHLLLTAIKLATVAMDPPPAGQVTSIAEIQAAFHRELEENPRGPDQWLLGWGYDNAMLSDRRHPTRADLDRVSTEVPSSCTSPPTRACSTPVRSS
jgi:predicted amidohydrolase YtcJ